jgi:ribosomal protein S18 acetylase RimI-like enzyme
MKIQITEGQLKRLVSEQVEEPTQNYIGQCDRVRMKPGGEEFWQEMMKNRKGISRDVFLSKVNPVEILDDDETLDEYFADDEITFYRSSVAGRELYFIATSGTNGFEFIWQVPNSVEQELNEIISKYDAQGMACWIHYEAEHEAIKISSIKVKDKSERRQGLGSRLMAEIAALCDRHGLLCVLSPDSSETPMSVLQRFYKSFGFKPNKGRNKDFRFMQSMIREPQ